MLVLHRIAGFFLLLSILLGACSSNPAALPSATGPPNDSPSPSIEETRPAAVPSATPVSLVSTVIPPPLSLGPDPESFPANYNPLTGQPVRDVKALRLPAMLVSISNFPATARPQSGLSFASYVFEFSITEGATRFLTVFYGDFPQPEIPFTGNCSVRMQPFVQTSVSVLGGRVWLDSIPDGFRSFDEPGIGGVCVNLYDASGTLVDQAVTDSHGYYGFNINAAEGSTAQSHLIEIVPPPGTMFTSSGVDSEFPVSDADPSGRISVNAGGFRGDLDAGLLMAGVTSPTPDPMKVLPKPQVGPVRSGRLVYADLARMFQDSCLVYAFASPEVQQQIPTCAMVVHEVSGGGYMFELDRMRAVAEDNRKDDTRFDYAGNLFTTDPPAGGIRASQVDVYFAWLNQSGWKYDPLMRSYLRFTDTTEQDTAGQLHPDTDRLNGRQLRFENLIILMTDHLVISPTNLDIDLEQGGRGPAYLFRDGLAYPIRWSTKAGTYEKETGFRRPIQWLDKDGSPAALKPGPTWVIVVTPFSSLSEAGAGLWKLRFAPPEGSK